MAETTTDGGRVAMGGAVVGEAIVVPTIGARTEAFVSMVKFLRMLAIIEKFNNEEQQSVGKKFD